MSMISSGSYQNLTIHTFQLTEELQDIGLINRIANSKLRIQALAKLVNCKHIPLKDLNIDKQDLRLLAPLLTYADCRDAFEGWSVEEIQDFLMLCSNNVTTLFVSSPEILNLPTFLNCVTFDCSFCISLQALPYLPKCENPVCNHCVIIEPNFPTDHEFEKIYSMANRELKYKIIGQLVNKHSIPLANLSVDKAEIKAIAPYLTYCDCRNILDSWSLTEINEFLNSCSNKVIILFVNSAALKKLPPLLNCIKLDCSDCLSLEELPPLPNCIDLNFLNCHYLQAVNLNLPPEIILDCSRLSLLIDIEAIRKVADPRICSKIMAFLINRDKLPIKFVEQLLTPQELISLARHLHFLDLKDAFVEWSVKNVKDFLTSCPWDQFSTNDVQSIVDAQEGKLAVSIPDFIHHYLAKTINVNAKERYCSFQYYLKLHSDHPILEKLKPWTEIILLHLIIDLPNVSLTDLKNRSEALTTTLETHNKELILAEIIKLEQKIAIKLQESHGEVENYLKSTLPMAIKQSLVPRNVFLQLLKATLSRIDYLKNAGLDPVEIDKLTESCQYLEESINSMFPYVTFDAPHLKEASGKEKMAFKHAELDARLLKGEQIERIPEKLQRAFSQIQRNFDKIDYTSFEITRVLSDRKRIKTHSHVEVLTEEALKKDMIPKKYSNLLGPVSIAHLQGDRPAQEDTHLAAVINVNAQDKHYKIPLYSIFDGHGGMDGSIFLAKELAPALERELTTALNMLENLDPKGLEAAIFNTLKTIYHKLTEQYKLFYDVRGGSTACTALVIDDTLWVANLGDSRAILSVNGLPIVLSQDAALRTKEQKKTILKRGGFISQGRVNGDLNMSRSACETDLPVNTRSTLTKFPLILLPPGQKYLCVACDGVFDVLSSNHVASKLCTDIELKFPDQIAKELVKEAYNKGSSDNISALVVDLNSISTLQTPFKESNEQKI